MKKISRHIRTGIYYKQRSTLNDYKNLVPGCITTIGLSLRRTLRRSDLYSAFSISLYLIVISFFLSSCENDEKIIDELTKNQTMVEEAKVVQIYLSQGGQTKTRLTAPLMLRVFADTIYVEFPNTLHCDFYNDSTKIETRLDSKYGKYFESQNKVYLRDSVVVINIKGDTLRSPDLWWDQNTKLIYTDKYAIYHGINKDIYGGKGMVATQGPEQHYF
jgi:LPS export ABC transporter protein LptC